MIFRDRSDAGRQLAARLTRYADRTDVLVLALPRGGVPVAYEVAKELKAPLDVFLCRARYRYSCFDHFGENTQAYGYAASFGLTESCENEVVSQLVELRRRAADYASRDGRVAADDFFFAEQNARLVKNAEEYYRSMFRQSVPSWNLRDRHMTETLDSLVAYLERQGQPAKLVVWEHNSHLGDARATEMGERGELNVGQLVRERHGSSAVLIGFSTHTGTVTAASDWDAPAERKRVRPALKDSYEARFMRWAFPASKSHCVKKALWCPL
ncbi:hypothetical protein BH20ACI3_BH20ACI3_19160 [soil metagenome]